MHFNLPRQEGKKKIDLHSGEKLYKMFDLCGLRSIVVICVNRQTSSWLQLEHTFVQTA